MLYLKAGNFGIRICLASIMLEFGPIHSCIVVPKVLLFGVPGTQ